MEIATLYTYLPHPFVYRRHTKVLLSYKCRPIKGPFLPQNPTPLALAKIKPQKTSPLSLPFSMAAWLM